MAIEQFLGGGTYQEGTIGNVYNYLDELRKKMKGGDLTQEDYLSQAAPLIQETQDFVSRLYGGGSSAATAAKAAGAQKFLDLKKEFDVYQTGRELFGRDLTDREVTAALPRFSDMETGRAYLAELAEQEAKSPSALRKKSGEFSGQVNDVFRSLLDRDATANEAEYYGSLLATGDISPFEIESLVKRGPEFQGREDTRFRGSLKDELMGYNREASEQAREDILSRLKRSGVSASEDAVAAALAESESDLTGELDRYLSGISAAQYGGNKAAAMGDYRDILDQYLGEQSYNRQRGDAKLDYYTGRSDSISDYNRQMQDYLNFLSAQPKQKKGGFGGALGTLAGVGLGVAVPGLGPVAGGMFGNATGGLFDYFLN